MNTLQWKAEELVLVVVTAFLEVAVSHQDRVYFPAVTGGDH